jgi:hypothetical protein
MPISVICTHCRKRLQIENQNLDKPVRCPGCKQVFVARAIPQASLPEGIQDNPVRSPVPQSVPPAFREIDVPARSSSEVPEASWQQSIWVRVTAALFALGVGAAGVPIFLLRESPLVAATLGLVGILLAALSVLITARGQWGLPVSLGSSMAAYAAMVLLLWLDPAHNDGVDHGRTESDLGKIGAWKDAVPAGMGFAATMPGDPRHVEESPAANIAVHRYEVLDPGKDVGYYVHVIDLSKISPDDLNHLPGVTRVRKDMDRWQIQQVLDEYMFHQVASAFPRGQIQTSRADPLNENFGTEFKVDVPPDLHVLRRAYIVDQRIYFATVSWSKAPDVPEAGKKFLDSFDLVDPKSPVDVILQDRRRDPTLPDAQGRLILKGSPGFVTSLCFRAEDKELLSRAGGQMTRWNPVTAKKIETFRFPESKEFAAPFALAPNGKYVLYCDQDNRFQVVDPDTKLSVREVGFGREGYCAFSSDGQLLFRLPGFGNPCKIFDVNSDKETTTIGDNNNRVPVYVAQFSPDKQRLAL